MCDYSLEAYKSRPAREGEQYVTHRFTSYAIGFIAPGDTQTAVCMACDMKLKLEGIPPSIQGSLGIGSGETVTFVRLDNGAFQDGIRFANNRELTLQQLGPGVHAVVVDALMTPRRVSRMADTLF